MVTIILGPNGVERVYSQASSISEGKVDAQVMDVALLGLHLVHQSVRDRFGYVAGDLQTFREELIDEITIILDGSWLRAVQLVEYLGWDEWRASSYEQLKKAIVDTRETGKKIDPSMHEDFLMTIGVFYQQLREAQQ